MGNGYSVESVHKMISLLCGNMFPWITSHNGDAWSFLLDYIILNPLTENAPLGAPFDAQTDKLGSTELRRPSTKIRDQKELNFHVSNLKFFSRKHSA